MRSSKNPRDDFAESASNPSKIVKNVFQIYHILANSPNGIVTFNYIGAG